jgi:hypothetical protein
MFAEELGDDYSAIRAATHKVALFIFATRDDTRECSTRLYHLSHGSAWCGNARGNTLTIMAQ